MHKFNMPNQAIKFAPFGRRMLVPHDVYGKRYVADHRLARGIKKGLCQAPNENS